MKKQNIGLRKPSNSLTKASGPTDSVKEKKNIYH